MKLFDTFIKKNSEWKVKSIVPYLKKNEKILDYGCGDFSFAKSLKKDIPSLRISGVDVVDFPEMKKPFPFYKYDGKKLPFKNNTFDTVIAFYVFHHTHDARDAFRECLRVGKRILFVESVVRNEFERPLMNLTDFLYNKWKSEDIPFTYQFLSFNDWNNVFKKEKVKNISCIIVKSGLPLLSFGEQVLFNIRK